MIKRQPARECAYTLLEVMMVMVIVATMSLIIAPNVVRSISRVNLESESKKLRAQIRSVQNLAKVSQDTYRIQFVVSSNVYNITYDPNGDFNFIPYKTLFINNNILISSTTFTQSPPGVDSVDFDYFGDPFPAGFIMLSDANNNIKTISIEDVTGKVEIY